MSSSDKSTANSKLLTIVVVGSAIVGGLLFFLARTSDDPRRTGDPAAADHAAAPDFGSLRDQRPFNVLVISLDTTRADRIGAYGFDGVETPSIDGLAASGVLFRRAYSPVPLTLPAHVSLFTGLYPFDHGVRDNAGFVVADELTTVAELFRERGYATAAFVASYVLAARWGLDQGFDTYIDGLAAQARRATVMNEAQRPANEVIDDAVQWLDGRPQGPFFAWVHLYDPHTPYAPPPPYDALYADDPYVGEIAFMDEQIGRLITELDSTGDADRTFVVLAGDHGESLGEHGEQEHGFFLYEPAIHVPLIVSTPFERFRGVETAAPVSLVDVMPTLLEMNGIAVPDNLDGRSLTPLFAATGPGDTSAVGSFAGRKAPGAADLPRSPAGAAPPGDSSGSDRTVYAETWYPRLHYGWSELTSVYDGRHKLIVSPEPELYDLRDDPTESVNLASEATPAYDRLSDVAEEILAGADPVVTQAVEVDAETRRTLESLGYLAGGSAAQGPDGERAAPASRIGVFNKSLQARSLMARGELDEAARLYNEILDDDPLVSIAYERLGDIFMLQGQFTAAAEVFAQGIPLRPDWNEWYLKLAEAQIGMGELGEAEQTLLGSVDLAQPVSHTYCLLGYISERKPDFREALDRYDSCRDLDEESATPLSHMARMYVQVGELQQAENLARRALALDPGSRGAHFALGQVLARRGDAAAAAAEYRAEVAANPDFVPAHFNLAMHYGELGQTVDEERHLEAVLELEPEHPVASLFLANIFLGRGDSYERAVALVTAAVEKPLSRQDLAAGYFILSNLHERLGNSALAREYLQRAESLRAP